MFCNAVFEGGGIKGIGLAGAVSEFENHGYKFLNTAGTSAGAIVACLVSAGYASEEIKEILISTDFKQFKQESFLSKFGLLGKTLKILFKFGIYKSDNFENWLNCLLDKKNVKVFNDFKTNSNKSGFSFQAIASNISTHEMMILPKSLEELGFIKEQYSISKSVQMSMSIPVFYEPFKLMDAKGKKHLIVDGGLLSNYPLWLLDCSDIPTIGFRFTSPEEIGKSECVDNIGKYLKALAETAIDAHDNYYLSNKGGDKERTVFISPTIEVNGKHKTIKTTDFDITPEESEAMFQNGIRAAKKFLASWNFETWYDKYRC